MAFDRNAAEDQSYGHKPVLLDECLDALAIRPDGIYVDCTLGGAGHSLQIAKRLSKNGLLIGIDRDREAIAAATERLKDYADRVTFVRNNFSSVKEVCEMLGIERIDGILMDLGVSSYQLDTPERGFSYMVDAPLDMRMNNEDSLSADTVVNTWSYEELKKILYEYGEERYAPRIAAAICSRREEKPIRTTLELVDIIRSAMPAAALREKQHPAKRSFQAIRIAVNDELGSVEKVMRDAIPCLNPGGRLAIITFHSLEDRIVKDMFVEHSSVEKVDKRIPLRPDQIKEADYQLLNKKPILPSDDENEENIIAIKSNPVSIRIVHYGSCEWCT